MTRKGVLTRWCAVKSVRLNAAGTLAVSLGEATMGTQLWGSALVLAVGCLTQQSVG